MPLHDTIADTCFTVKELQEKLQSNLNTDAHFKSWTVKPIGDGQGFMAKVLRVAIEWSKEAGDLPKSVVVKIPNVGNAGKAWENAGIQSDTAADTNTLVVTQMHDNECRAYNWLSAKTSSVPHPRIYYCNGDFTNPKNPPVIIMEDLTQYQIVSLFTGFNRAQLFAITDAIATIHVRSILEPDDKWMFDLGFKDPSMETNFVNMIHAMGGMLKQIRPDMFGANVDKILESMNPSLFQEKLMSKKIFPVLAHGDLWSTNLLWDGDKLMSIIDWQIARASSVTEDLLRVLVTCVPVDVRRAMTSELLAHYYAKLTELLAVEQRQVPFSFADVERSYRETLPSTAAQTIFAAGMWINSPVVDGPDKPQRVEEVLQRTKAILDDAAVALEEQ